MKHILAILLLLMLNATTMAQLGVALNNNDFLYERYAQRTDITVAQILNYPIDSNLFVNIVMLQADNDNAWERLKEEFKEVIIAIPPEEQTRWCIDSKLMDYNNPTKNAPTNNKGKPKILNSCYVTVFYHMQSILIFHYPTIKEFNGIFKVILNTNFKL